MQSKYDFNQEANTYDDYYNSPTGKLIDIDEKRCVKLFLDQISKGNMLELGCGTGRWTEWLTEQGFSVLGIDIAEDMMKKAKLKNIANSTFEIMSMTDLRFEDKSIENIIAITSLEFTIDLNKTFSEIKRVLKPGGYFIAAVLNNNSIIGKNKANNPTFANAHFFTKSEIIERLSSFGSPKTCESAFMNDNFEFTENNGTEPAMIVGFVKNTL